MPILGEHDVLEAPGEPIDERHDLVPVRHGQATAGAEVVLNVHDEKNIAICGPDGLRHVV